MMHATTLSSFSLTSRRTQDIVQVPADAAGQCQRPVRLFWAPLCELAFVVLSSPPVGHGGGRTTWDLPEKVLVAAFVVKRGLGSEMQADAEHGRSSATVHGELACLVSARDAVLVLERERSRGGTQMPTPQVENGQTGLEDAYVCSWVPKCLFLEADGKSLTWLPLEGVRETGAVDAAADGSTDAAGGQGAGQGCNAWNGEDVWRVSVEALRKNCESVAQPSLQVGIRLALPPEVVLSRVWPRPLPPRLPRAEQEIHSGDAADLTKVAGWDVRGNRVVLLSCLRAQFGAGSRGASSSGAGVCRLVSCHSIITLGANEAVVEVAWRGCVDMAGDAPDAIAVLTTHRVVVVEGSGSVTAGAGDCYRVVGEVVERFIESVMLVGGALCFSSSSCLRVLHLSSTLARSATPCCATSEVSAHADVKGSSLSKARQRSLSGDYAEWSLETLCMLDTCGGKLAACLSDRIVYVAQEHGVPFIVSRPIGLLDLLLRGGGRLGEAGEGGAAPTRGGEYSKSDPARRGRGHGISTAAAHVLERFDCRRSTPELLAALCEAGEKPLAWALSQRMPWLPLHHVLGLAFQCGKHKYCIGLMDAMARSGASTLRALAQHYREVGQACLECDARATAAQAFVRAGLCGWEECFWTLYDMFDTHNDEQGLAALLAIASKCNLSYLRVACAARLGVDVSDDLLPDGICRAGLGVGGGVGGWWERWGGLLPWEALLGSTSWDDDENAGESDGQRSWHSLHDIEPAGGRDRSAVAPSEIAVEQVNFATRTAVGKVWVGRSGTGGGKEDLPDINLDMYENWLSWRSLSPAALSRQSHPVAGKRARGTRDVSLPSTPIGDSRFAGPLHVQGGSRDGVGGDEKDASTRSSASVDAEGYSIRPSGVENMGRKNNNPFASKPISSRSDSEGDDKEEEEEEEAFKPVIRLTIKSVDEVNVEDNKLALQDIMKQMMSVPGDEADVVGRQVPGMLDIGLGSASLFANKSRRRTVEMPPSAVAQPESQADGRPPPPILPSLPPLSTDPFAGDPFGTDPFARDPLETAQSVAFSEGFDLDFGRSVESQFLQGSNFTADPFRADPFRENVSDTDSPFGADPFASFPSASSRGGLDSEPPAPDGGLHAEIFVPGGDFGSDPFASTSDPFASSALDMKQTQPTALTDETQHVSTALISPRSDTSRSEAVGIDAGCDFGSDPFAMSSDPFGSTALDMEQKQATAFTDEAQDTEPDISSWAAEVDAEERNHVALEQDPSVWASEVSERRACVS